MKKFIVSVFLALACALTVCAFAGCNTSANDNSGNQSTVSVSDVVVFGEKYVYVTDMSSINEYFILKADGTAQYHSYHDYGSVISSYYVDLKWEETTDNLLHFIYVKGEFKEDNTSNAEQLRYSRGPFSYSKDILVLGGTYGGSQYVRENSRLDVNND